MEKDKVYESGNARFQRWKCNSCWREESQALGIVGGMDESSGDE